MQNDSRVVVVGSSGIIGQRLCEFFAARNIPVIGICRGLTGSQKLHRLSYPILEVGDFTKFFNWRELLGDSDLVLFVGDSSSYSSLERLTGLMSESRQIGLASSVIRRLVSACQQFDGARFVYFSSANLYDQGQDGLKSSINEDAELLIQGLYAQVKHACEEALMCTMNEEKRSSMILRLPIVYGAGGNNAMTRLFKFARSPMILPAILVNDRPISTLCINNLVDAVWHIYKKKKMMKTVYHIADSEPLNLIQIWRLLKGFQNDVGEQKESIACRFKTIKVGRFLDDSRFRNDYDWHPKIKASEGILSVFHGPQTLYD